MNGESPGSKNRFPVLLLKAEFNLSQNARLATSLYTSYTDGEQGAGDPMSSVHNSTSPMMGGREEKSTNECKIRFQQLNLVLDEGRLGHLAANSISSLQSSYFY